MANNYDIFISYKREDKLSGYLSKMLEEKLFQAGFVIFVDHDNSGTKQLAADGWVESELDNAGLHREACRKFFLLYSHPQCSSNSKWEYDLICGLDKSDQPNKQTSLARLLHRKLADSLKERIVSTLGKRLCVEKFESHKLQCRSYKHCEEDYQSLEDWDRWIYDSDEQQDDGVHFTKCDSKLQELSKSFDLSSGCWDLWEKYSESLSERNKVVDETPLSFTIKPVTRGHIIVLTIKTEGKEKVVEKWLVRAPSDNSKDSILEWLVMVRSLLPQLVVRVSVEQKLIRSKSVAPLLKVSYQFPTFIRAGAGGNTIQLPLIFYHEDHQCSWIGNY